MSSESKPKIFSKVQATLDSEWLAEQSSKQSVSEILTQIENLGEGQVQISFKRGQHVVSGSLELINRIYDSLVYGSQEKYTSIVSSQLCYNIRLNALQGVAEERSISPDQFMSCRDFSARDERLKKNADIKNDCKPGGSKDEEVDTSSSSVKVIRSEDSSNVDEDLSDQRKSGNDNFELPEKSGVEFIVLNDSTESGNKEDEKEILIKDFMVDPDIWRYIENNKREMIDNLKCNLGVWINSEEDESGVFKIIISGYDQENIDNSHSALVQLYNDTFERCEIEETSYSYEDEQQKKLLLSYMSRNFSDVYTEHNTENDSFMFIGPPEKVQSAKSHFKDVVVKLEREGPQSLEMPDTGKEFVCSTKAGSVSFSDSSRIGPLNIGSSSRRSVGSDGRTGGEGSRSFEHKTGFSDHREHREKNFKQSRGHTSHTEVGRNCSTCRPEPGGSVSYSLKKSHLPGYEGCQTFEMTFGFTVYDSLRNPKPFSQTTYLPACEEGQAILQLMKQAFDENMLFRICTPIETDEHGEVVSNGIEFKTEISGKKGYPDPEYLDRVKRQLDHLLKK